MIHLELCTEQTDETHRLFNDPHVSTSVGVRAAGTFLAPGNNRLSSQIGEHVGHGIGTVKICRSDEYTWPP